MMHVVLQIQVFSQKILVKKKKKNLKIHFLLYCWQYQLKVTFSQSCCILNVLLKNGVFLKSNMEVKPNESFFFRQTSNTVYFAKRTKQDGS